MYFEHNPEVNFNESYSNFEKELEKFLEKMDVSAEEVKKIQEVIYQGIRLQRYTTLLAEIEVSYQNISNSISVIWTFLKNENTESIEEYAQYANDMLRDLGMEGILKHRKVEERVFNKHKVNQTQEVLDSFPTSPFYLVEMFESPIFITKGNTKIDFKQYYNLKK